MANGIGYSFQPGGQDIQTDATGSASGRGLSPQEAVKILSLRIPERPSPTAIAPMPLLTSQGGAGVPGLDSLVAALMQSFQGTGADAPGESGSGGAQYDEGTGFTEMPTPSWAPTLPPKFTFDTPPVELSPLPEPEGVPGQEPPSLFDEEPPHKASNKPYWMDDGLI
jgi:hypothetical protein